ncbi:hypothetical protein EJ02DRAFT_458771 [Clathrospora elynae]|uniref:Uncharacterized protein n=1 Tax=Clathrospora elynae TaxID=706981 RepID=A0A6A5SFY1_9PLEO|nr:hypothetical protein EJ02DRAFT_458771 [Clathrospora elynae]
MHSDREVQRETTNAAQSGSTSGAPSSSNIAVLAMQPAANLVAAPKSLASLKAEFDALIPPAVALDLTNLARTVMQLGGRKPKRLEVRCAKIRNIVLGNRQIVGLWNEYAKLQAAGEKRRTYRLPVFGDIEEKSKAVGQEVTVEAGKSRDVDRTQVADDEMVLEGTVAREQGDRSEGRVQEKYIGRRANGEDIDMEDASEPVTVQLEGPWNIDRESVPSPSPLPHIPERFQLGTSELSPPRSEGPREPVPLPSHHALETTQHSTANLALAQKPGPQLRERETSHPPLRHMSEASHPTPSGTACDKHTEHHCTIVPVQNPEEFPVFRIQEVQAQYYPSTRILAMWSHRSLANTVTQVTLDIDKGSVNHLLINNPHIITTLGVREGANDFLLPGAQYEARIDETYTISVLPNQHPNNPKAWIVGELVPARHSYLYWLDSRHSADPKGPPTVAEARILASQLGRRSMDVMREIERVWKLEQGNGGRRYRENRLRYLGEDPSYPEGEEETRSGSMWV